jgi:hypothetical protein
MPTKITNDATAQPAAEPRAVEEAVDLAHALEQAKMKDLCRDGAITLEDKIYCKICAKTVSSIQKAACVNVNCQK